tara:strand:- start:19 stop:708 length:690 start_codon:yes stop_codon:yes gene_type:complete
MRHATPLLLGALLLGAFLAPQAQGEELEGDFRRSSSGSYELRIAGKTYRVEGQVPVDLRIVNEGRVRVDVLRGATTVMVRRLVAPQLETLQLEVLPHAKGEAWSARLGGRTYSLAGRTHLMERLGIQGPVTVRGYRLPHTRQVVVRSVRAETSGLSLTRVARYIPVPPPIRFTLPRGVIRKGQEIWVTQADSSFVTFQTRKGKERLIKRDKVSIAPRGAKSGIIRGLAK